ncbi:MAG: hypothetical protein ACYTG7_23300 [Planctomycetota bacterium]|jgi:hypothetical protein
MIHGHLKSTLAVLFFLLLFYTAPFHADSQAQTPTWKAELLGTPPASWSSAWAAAVNDAGLAVGNTYLSGYKRAWIAGPTQPLEILPLPPGATWSQANDINASGVIAGQVLFGSASQGVIWRPGSRGYEYFLLPSGPGGWVPFNATGINDAGDVIGKYGILGGSYLWNEATGVNQITTAQFPKTPADINEQRQILAGTYRMDLDTMVLEDLGNPTGTGFNYLFTELSVLNDAGECGGYANTATGSNWSKQAVRYTDGPVWKAFNNTPLIAAGVGGLAASGDATFHLDLFGQFVYVEGYGSIELQNTLAPAYTDWDLTDSFAPAISRSGRLACNGSNSSTGESGIVLLTPLAFEDLGGASRGALGDPVLSGYGTLIPGDSTRLRLASAAPDSTVYFAVSTTSNPVPLYGGTLHANPPSLIVPFQTNAFGRFELTFDWPSAPPGTTIYLQAAIVDPEAMAGAALSNALLGVTQ